MTNWHDDDAFWTLMAPFMFDEARWASTAAEIDLITELAQMAPGTAVLDLGCGPGRHSLELARRGHRVTGVDRTRHYLQQAREKADQEGLAVEFMEADMRAFRKPARFDVALNLFTAFGYFEDAAENERVLCNVYDSLREGGVLLIETMGKEILARIYQHRDWREQDGVLFLEERLPAKNWSWLDVRWILVDGGKTTEFKLGHWLYSAVELEQMLCKAGFSGVDIYGDLEGRPYDQTASRLVALARK